ncbi:hypothetical protein [Lacrimispora sp.]|uniref:hypothetical protein n=1 Tax=Lacrimispora sp. TaxID=2719234 RepID=UPI003995D950
MGKVIIAGGGGSGTGSDECTASKAEVLKGFSAITSDSGDEVAEGTLELTGDAADSQVLEKKTYYNKDAKIKRTGTMPNRGAVNQALNAGVSYSIPAGYHNGAGKVTANSLASQTPGNADSGSILSGRSAWVNGSKVDGVIPWQNAEVAGTDRAWSQGMSNWAGTINLKVRNGHYLNGVNWIQQDIPNYRPENIKRGVDIGGIIGTWEGYVPVAQDLYSYGNNVGNFQTYTGSNPGAVGIRFESGMIYLSGTASSYQRLVKQLDLTGINYVNVLCAHPNNTGRLIIEIQTSIGGSYSARLDQTNIGSQTVLSLNVAAIQAIRYISIGCGNLALYIYRIWTS